MQFNRCMRCMQITDTYPCPHCGYDGAPPQNRYALKPGTIISEKYVVGCLIGQGGFGMTYVGFDLALEKKVAIKEYFPSGQVTRGEQTGTALLWNDTAAARQMQTEGPELFLKEARKMARVDRINEVVRVLDTFLQNDTAYIVMDYAEGETLKARLDREGALTWAQAREIFYPAVRAMQKVHAAGLIHRDLSPDNIMLTPEGEIRILDLGAAKDLNVNTGASSMLVAKGGFSPIEQYMERGGSGPWTDVYAMAATMYYALTRTLPPAANDRLYEDSLNMDLPELRALPREAIAALTHALAVRTQDRTQSMEQFLGELQGGAPAAKAAPKAAASAKPVKPAEAPAPDKKKSPLPVILVILAVLLLGAAAGYFLIHDYSNPTCTEPAVCRICGRESSPALGHTWADATCTEPKTCTVCGTTEGEALGHTWADATCTEPKTCTVCGATEGEPLGHDWVDATCTVVKTCARCGLEEGALSDHTWAEATCEEPKHCTVCGVTEGRALGHTWADATCTEPKTCMVCGATEGEPLGHDMREATCAEHAKCTRCGYEANGLKAHTWVPADCVTPRTCSVCGATDGAPLGHDFAPATCTEPKTCRECGFTEGEPLGHTPQAVPAVSPTCTETGLTEGSVCSVCGETLTAQKIVPALGHDFAPATRELPKTCRTCGLTEGEPIKIQVGDYITFGHYEQDNNTSNGQETVEWLVLDVQGSQALVISRYGLDAKPYNTNKTDVTWETCTLRTWLNNDFLNAAFSTEEQEAILLTTVDNSKSQCYSGYSTTGGNNTKDRVFLLSYAEANKYLGVEYWSVDGAQDNLESRTSPTAYAKANGAYTSDSYKTSDGVAAGWWWLRSPGDRQYGAAYVFYYGALYYFHYVYYSDAMVRPALIINLDSGLF